MPTTRTRSTSTCRRRSNDAPLTAPSDRRLRGRRFAASAGDHQPRLLPVGRRKCARRAAACRRCTGRAGSIRGRGAGRRLLLGRAGRVPACRGCHQRRVRLCRRRPGDGAVRQGHVGPHRSRRGRAHHLRPAQGEPGPAAADPFLGGARSHAAQSPGARCRLALPVDNLPDQRRAGAGGQGLCRAARPGARLQRQGRDHDRARPDLLSGRGLSPGLHDAPSAPALHRHARPAEGRQSQAAVPRRPIAPSRRWSPRPACEPIRPSPDEAAAAAARSSPARCRR